MNVNLHITVFRCSQKVIKARSLVSLEYFMLSTVFMYKFALKRS